MASFAEASKITKREHLLSNENIEAIFQNYFKDKSVKVVSVDRKQGDVVEGINNNFQSELEKWTISFNKNKDDKNEESGRTIGIVVKSTIPTWFQKFTAKVHLTFLREVFWYTKALPIFEEQFPIIGTMVSPKGYFGYTRYSEDDW